MLGELEFLSEVPGLGASFRCTDSLYDDVTFRAAISAVKYVVRSAWRRLLLKIICYAQCSVACSVTRDVNELAPSLFAIFLTGNNFRVSVDFNPQLSL